MVIKYGKKAPAGVKFVLAFIEKTKLNYCNTLKKYIFLNRRLQQFYILNKKMAKNVYLCDSFCNI